MRIILVLLYITIVFTSCKEDSKVISPPSSGNERHILIIMTEGEKAGELGKTVKDILQADVPALPQDEPMFDLSILPPQKFNYLYKRNKNIIITKVSDKVKETQINIQYNLWAKPQMVMVITAPSGKDLPLAFKSNKRRILDILNQSSFARMINQYKRSSNVEAKRYVKETFGIDIEIPISYKSATKKEKFYWISRETQKISQGIMIWEYPYKDSTDLTLENLMLVRDSITLNHVPGPIDGSYMTTERRMPFYYRELTVNKTTVYSVRGLWDTKGHREALMGGPFVSHTIYDKKNNRIITADAYVYAGKQDKRDFLKEAEAVLYSIKLAE